MSAFSNTLIYLRKREKMTQQELADKIGLSRSAIGMMESGDRMPSFEVLESIADTFNVNIDFLIGHSDSGEYSAIFRKNLSEILNNSSRSDLEAAGIDVYEAKLIVDGALPLSFDDACALAERLGETIDSMLNEKDPAAMEDSRVTREIIGVLSGLPEGKLQAAMEYLRYLSDSEGR